MFNLTMGTIIETPIQRVFDFMTTPENNFQWQSGTLASATISSHLNRMGVYFRSIGHFLGHRNLGTYQVIESSQNRKYQFISISGPLYLNSSYMFEAVDEGTRVKISVHVGTRNFFHINERILEKRMKKQFKENLTVLKTLLEEK